MSNEGKRSGFFGVFNQLQQSAEGRAFLGLAEKVMHDLGHAAMSPVHVILAVLSEPQPDSVSDRQWSVVKMQLDKHGITLDRTRHLAEQMGDGGYRVQVGSDGVSAYFFDEEMKRVLSQLSVSRESYLRSAESKPFDPDRPTWEWPEMLVRILLVSDCRSVNELIQHPQA